MDLDEALVWALAGAVEGLVLAAVSGRWIAVPFLAVCEPLAIMAAGAIDEAIFRIGLVCDRMRYGSGKGHHA